MLSRISLIFSLLIYSSISLASNPTIEESLAFVNEKINQRGSALSKIKSLSYNHEEQCNLGITGKNYQDIIRLSDVNVSSLDNIHIVNLTEQSPFYNPNMGLPPSYIYEVRIEENNGIHHTLVFNDKDSAIRVARAFTHMAGNLCKAKGELF